MSAIVEQEFRSAVKASLFQFISKNLPSASLEVVDDIILKYVISILEETAEDPCFDVEGFVEVMASWFPGFEDLEMDRVLSWVLELESELTQGTETMDVSSHDGSAGSDKICLTMQNIAETLPLANTKPIRSHSNSESSHDGDTRRAPDLEPYLWQEQCAALHEMFPNTCVMEIRHCVSISSGSLERAAAALLHRRELGQALPRAPAPPARAAPPIVPDHELKHRIIERYSYVDSEAAAREHKPLAPKIEPKKMVRYRDNKIVSLKGERYTEVPKAGVDEENLKKPKRPHCP